MEIIILILLILVLILLVYLMMRPQDKKAWESELNQLRLDLLKDHNESMQRLQNQLRADIREAMQPTGEKLTMFQKEFNMTKAELQQDIQAGFSLMRSQMLESLQKQLDLLETSGRQNEKTMKDLQSALTKDLSEQNQRASASLMTQIKDGLSIIQEQNSKKLQEMLSGIDTRLSS